MSNNKHKEKKNGHKNSITSDMDEWPANWAGDEHDIPIGKVILMEFKEFMLEQLDRISTKTLMDYKNYLFALGGEVIRDTNENEIRIDDLEDNFLFNYLDDTGGPFWRHAINEQDYLRYHSICRRFYKYLKKRKKSLCSPEIAKAKHLNINSRIPTK